MFIISSIIISSILDHVTILFMLLRTWENNIAIEVIIN